MLASRGNSNSLPGLINPCPSGWGLDARRLSLLSLLSTATCLFDNQPAWHISYRGSASQPWTAISMFDTGSTGSGLFTTSGGYAAPTTGNWERYQGEIILAKVDGSAAYRVAHTRSRTLESFWAQPHAAISRSGRYVVFTSNMAHPNGCPANMHVPDECQDVYIIKVS